jgi:hypothetical protein
VRLEGLSKTKKCNYFNGNPTRDLPASNIQYTILALHFVLIRKDEITEFNNGDV